MIPVEPILTVDLFPPLSRELLALLRRLGPHDWARSTPCPGWSVKDVAAHLLGGSLSRTSAGSDAPVAPSTLSYTELVNFIDRENAEWVRAGRRISPDLLIEYLALADEQLYQHFKALPPDAPARIAVSWAGDQESPVWFDVAREYTEKWLHQQHIREAVGQPLLIGRRWLFPVLDTFMRALPRTYRPVAAPEGTLVTFHILGEAGGDWTLRRQVGAWALFSGAADAEPPAARALLDQDLAWRLFTKSISPALARPHLHIEGDEALAAPILNMVSIMA